jgi:hypothetical protein
VHTYTFQTGANQRADGGSSSNQPELPSRLQPKKCIQIYILILIAKTPVIITLVYIKQKGNPES